MFATFDPVVDSPPVLPLMYTTEDSSGRDWRVITVLPLRTADGRVVRVPFYKSSGTCSGTGETWFPMQGVSLVAFKYGWFIKPMEPHVGELIRDFDLPHDHRWMPERFGSAVLMRASAWLSGEAGFWGTDDGQRVRRDLLGDLPSRRGHILWDDGTDHEPTQQCTLEGDAPKRINDWLTQQGASLHPRAGGRL